MPTTTIKIPIIPDSVNILKSKKEPTRIKSTIEIISHNLLK